MRDTDPWFVTPLIKSVLRKRNKFRRRGDIKTADALSVKVNELISGVRKSCFSNIDRADSKKLWKTIDKTTNYKGGKKSMTMDGIKIDEFVKKVNEHFVNIATDVTYDQNIIKSTVTNNLPHCSKTNYVSISEGTVFEGLSKLKKTSPGSDLIPHWFYRECAAEISEVVTSLINRSLRYGIVPSRWKEALVTPVPKKSNVSIEDLNNLRPISVTPILSRFTEKLVVKLHLWPKLNDDLMCDQFGFRPTGSTSAALIDLVHFVYTKFNEGSDYVRCLLVDYSRAFDVVNHQILLEELGTLGLEENIYRWVADFLTGRTQAVKMSDVVSVFLAISQSIVQGSGLGPTLYIALARRLKALSEVNKIIKYADDTTLLVPQHSDVSMEDEFQNIQDWSAKNKLKINNTKTKEIIFWRSRQCVNKYNIPLLVGIERVNSVVLLGVTLDMHLTWTLHIDQLLMQAAQRFYLLNQLKHMGLTISGGLSNVFQALVVSRVRYALPVFSGNMSQSDIGRINSLFKKGKRWGIADQIFDLQQLAIASDLCLSKKASSGDHCLHPLIPSLKPRPFYDLRERLANLHIVPKFTYDNLRKSFIYRNFN